MVEGKGLPAVVEPLIERIEQWGFRDGGWLSVPWPDHFDLHQIRSCKDLHRNRFNDRPASLQLP